MLSKVYKELGRGLRGLHSYICCMSTSNLDWNVAEVVVNRQAGVEIFK